MRYYKIVFGYDAEDVIHIEEGELEKSLYAHMSGKNMLINGGSITGSKIIAIQPDYHRAMGWNLGWKLGTDDYEELSRYGVDTDHMRFFATAKDRVMLLISTGNTEFIGKEVPAEIANRIGLPSPK